MLFVVTPLSRPENFSELKSSIFSQISETQHEFVCWYVVMDAAIASKELHEKLSSECVGLPVFITTSVYKNAPVGHAHRNLFIEYYRSEINPECNRQNDWVYFLDDDTVMLPNFMQDFLPNMVDSKCAIVFHQKNANDTPRLFADLGNIKVCHIDMGQYVVNITRLPHDIWFLQEDYCADGHFIEELFNRVGPTEFLLIDKTLSVYNALQNLEKEIIDNVQETPAAETEKDISEYQFLPVQPINFEWAPKEDITVYELAQCLSIFHPKQPIMPGEIDLTLPFLRHFIIIDLQKQV